jgi:hypothetical protein
MPPFSFDGLAHEDPKVHCCGRLGRAAARPYRIGPGRDDLPVVRVKLNAELTPPNFPRTLVTLVKVMGTWNVLYVRSIGDSTTSAIAKIFPDARVELGRDFIGVTLASDDYVSPTCDLAELSSKLGTEVIWLSFQSVVDAFQFHHWQSGILARSLVFGCFGEEERTWNRVEGQPEPWEREAFFEPRMLGNLLRYAGTDEKKREYERIWREAELVPDRTEPSIDARESARKAAEYYHFPGWS